MVTIFMILVAIVCGMAALGLIALVVLVADWVDERRQDRKMGLM